MLRDDLDPVARLLIRSYFGTFLYSRWFLDNFKSPPTSMDKAHTFRSIAGAKVVQHPGLELGKSWVEFGRVQITHSDSGKVFVLRSQGATTAEQKTSAPALLDSNQYLQPPIHRPEILVVYRFGRNALALSAAGSEMRGKSARLEMSGPAVLVDTWPYSSVDDDPDDSRTFHQGAADAFEDLDSLNFDIDGEHG